MVVRLEMRLELKFCGSADEVKYFVSKHYQSIYFFSAFTVLLHIVLLEYCTNCRNHCTSLRGLYPQWLYFPIGRTSPPNVMLWSDRVTSFLITVHDQVIWLRFLGSERHLQNFNLLHIRFRLERSWDSFHFGIWNHLCPREECVYLLCISLLGKPNNKMMADFKANLTS